MSYSNEKSNPFGSNSFVELFTDEDIENMKGIVNIVEQITK